MKRYLWLMLVLVLVGLLCWGTASETSGASRVLYQANSVQSIQILPAILIFLFALVVYLYLPHRR